MVFRQDPFRQLLATTRKGVRGRLKRDALSAISCNGKLVPSHGVLRPYWQTACRCLSSTGSNAFANTFGLKFSISPEKALQKFEYWARSEQGLNRFVLPRSSIRISAAYCPVWSFDINIRYIKTNKKTGKKRFDWKPDLFSIYGTQSVIHLAGLSAYAGYTYRRSLIDPLHNTSLIFLGDKTVPFGSWMLQDMKLETGESLSVSPDPWNATRGRAWDVVKEGLSSLPGVEDSGMESQPQVQTEIVSARRVYMPTYSVNYHILGMEYQAFVSGCDDGASVSGASHKVVDWNQSEIHRNATNFIESSFSAVQSGKRIIGSRQMGTVILVALQFFGNLAARLLVRLSWIGALGGVFVGFRKIVQPWMDSRLATSEWERQRHREVSTLDKNQNNDDFVDSGAAQRYFSANRARILHHFEGSTQHVDGSFDWYAQWEEWARQQWTQQQTQQNSQASGQQQQHQQQQKQQRPPRKANQSAKSDFKWDFNPDDPYSVLGIHRGASKTEISAAFRKQIMTHHPDTKTGCSENEKARAVERSKLITRAYQMLKAR